MQNSITTPETPSSNRRWKRLFCCGALAAILLIAMAIRVYNLDKQSLWYDEILTALRAQESVAWLVTSEPLRSWPLLYLVTKLSYFLFGLSDFATRIPSVLVGVLGVAAMYRMGSTLFGRSEGLIAAMLLALSPLHIHASRDARYYAMSVLLCLITTTLMWYALRTGQRRYWAAFVFVTVVAMLNHPSALLVLAGQTVFLGLLWITSLADRSGSRQDTSGSQRFPPRTFLTPIVVVLTLALMATAYLLFLPGNMAATLIGQGYEASSVVELSWSFFSGLVDALAGGSGLISAVFFAAFLLGVVISVRRDPATTALFLAILLVPMAVLPLLRLRISFVYKYLVFMLPPYLLVASRGIDTLFSVTSHASQQRSALRSLAAILSGLLVLTVLLVYGARGAYRQARQQTEAWREMAAFLEERARTDEPVVVAPMLGPLNAPSSDHVFEYYWPQDRPIYSTQSVSDLCSQHPAIWTISTPPYTPVLDLVAETPASSRRSSFEFYPSFQVDYWTCAAQP